MSFYAVQALTGLAEAASLFLVASGLSLIFGVTRIVNFAHGSLYMVGAYVAYTLSGAFAQTGLGFWLAAVAAAVAVGVLGALTEILLLRRLYRSPELFQLVATFAVVLLVQDLVLFLWGPDDLLGPRPPGLEGAVALGAFRIPAYDLVLVAIGPAVLALLWWLLHRTRFGILVRAATEDREMVAALGVNQRLLFTGVFFLGACLAGFGGALQLPREPANLGMDLGVIAEVFVVVVIGGMGSIVGAFLAAVLIAELHAFGILVFPEITLVLMFLVMAVVLVVRPYGLLGRPEAAGHGGHGQPGPPLRSMTAAGRAAVAVGIAILCGLPLFGNAYALLIATEIIIFALFAVSLHFILGIGGLISFGHALYLGLGAYAAAFVVVGAGLPMEVALVAAPIAGACGAAIAGWFCVRLSGVYLAMLTLAFAQIAWSVAFQWYEVTGGDNGILGVWPAAWAAGPAAYYYLVLGLSLACLALYRSAALAPFGFGLRAARDSALRAESLGLSIPRVRWAAFVVAGAGAGLAGGLYAFLKGSVFPTYMEIPVSVEALVMVLLGGVESLSGPVFGSLAFVGLKTEAAGQTDLWRAILGTVILVLVVAFPRGLAGVLDRVRARNAGAGAGP